MGGLVPARLRDPLVGWAGGLVSRPTTLEVFLERTGIRLLIAFATLIVFAWSVVMVVYGQVAVIAVLAPALGLTVQQIVRLARPQARTAAFADRRDEAP